MILAHITRVMIVINIKSEMKVVIVNYNKSTVYSH